MSESAPFPELQTWPSKEVLLSGEPESWSLLYSSLKVLLNPSISILPFSELEIDKINSVVVYFYL